MVKAYCRRRRCIGLLLGLMLVAGLSKGQTPATTRISDAVFRADGTVECLNASVWMKK